jgi:hypothetical protein
MHAAAVPAQLLLEHIAPEVGGGLDIAERIDPRRGHFRRIDRYRCDS